MDKPLTIWYCDVCGGAIDDASSGYVIWQSLKQHYFHFKIIHQSKCDLKDHAASAALKDFLGNKGLSYCMTFLSLGPVIENNGSANCCKVSDMDEFADFVRRVQIEYYEEARRLFGKPELLEDLADANEFYPYIPEKMRELIRRYS